jgi:endonuclease/exonuclease/phosphatase family metal-dependent hydrolase
MGKTRDLFTSYWRCAAVGVFAAGLAACALPVDKELSLAGAPPRAANKGATRPELFDAPGDRGDGVIYVGSFNIQNLGRTKAGRPEVMERLGEIIRHHDIIAIQEVSDITETTPAILLNFVNQDGAFYDFVLSARSGQQDDDQSSQEQYAVFYDTGVIELVDDLGLFDDAASDEFQREPHVAQFRTLDGDFEFALINIHTRPEAAVEEIGALDRAATWASDALGDTLLIILGDFNGGCNYASPDELDQLEIRGDQYVWVVPDDTDTNLASKACAYDRIVLTDDARYEGEWDVWQAFQSKKISDHWPIWAAFRTEN